MYTTIAHRRMSRYLRINNTMGPALALIGLLFFTGCIIADLDSDDAFGNNDFEARQTFSINVDVTSQFRVRLEAINGNVEIVGRSGATTVEISGEKKVSSSSRSDAERRLDDLDVVVKEQTDEIIIRTIQPENTRGRNYTVNYTITIPADLVVDIENVNGNIDVFDIDNDVLVDNTNGNVRLDTIVGNASVILTNGNITSEVTPPQSGAIELATTNGNIDLDIPRTTSASFSARVSNGSIDLDCFRATHGSFWSIDARFLGPYFQYEPPKSFIAGPKIPSSPVLQGDLWSVGLL